MTVGNAAPRSPLLAPAVLVAALLYFATGPMLRPLVHPYVYSDFVTFYSAARCFAAHQDPYDSRALRQEGGPSFAGWIGGYYYPPPFAAVAVRPLAALPFEVARRVWVGIEAAAYIAALALLAARLPGPLVVRCAALAVLGLAYAPIGLDLKLGSVSGLLLLLVALFLRDWHRGARWRAALALGAAVLLKLSPTLVLAYLAARGEWRFALRAAAAAAALALACLPFTGLGAWIDYATRVVPYLLTANFSWFTNQSLDALFWRLFVPNPDTTPWTASPMLYRAASGAASLLVLAALARIAWASRRAPATGARFDLEIGVALAAAVLLSRVAWEYLAVLALPAFAGWASLAARGESGARTTLAAGLAWALCALPFPYAESPLRSGVGLLFESPRTYGMLLVVLLAVLEQGRSRVARAEAPDAAPIRAA